ncbi:matrixin family metalloprotease [bacterium]|nr:matrixin family metalloprotease [bacterium]
MPNTQLYLIISIILSSPWAFAFKMISFNGSVARWHNSVVDYVIDSRGSDNFSGGCDSHGPCESERQAINKAFQSWENIDHINLKFNEQSSKTISRTGYNNENSIKWVESNWTSQSFAPSSRVIAVTVQTFKTSNNEILDMDIYANGQYFEWGVINSATERNAGNIMDIQNIFTHEIGHGIGIDHSSENFSEKSTAHYLATMFYASGPGETFRRDLEALDIAAAQHAYNNQSLPKPSVDHISQKSFNLSNQYIYQVNIEGSNFRNTTLVSLKVGIYNDDLQAKIVSQDSDSMLVEFNFLGMPSGTYDLRVANSYQDNDLAIVSDAIVIESPYAAAEEYSNTTDPLADKKACQSNSSPSLIMLLLTVLSMLIIQRKSIRLSHAA